MENKPVSISGGASFVYDGDGSRIKKTEGRETILYVNQYYEKNLTTSEVTTYYYHGSKLVAQRKNTTLSYIHQDSLSSTSVMSTSGGTVAGTIKYFPFGSTRSTSGTIDTDKKFTGQRLDDISLYYYNARYYDPEIGRFISPDSIVPSPANPQSLNRYSYCYNNPLKYVDPSGHIVEIENEALALQCINYGYIDENTWGLISQWASLRNAWDTLCAIEPALTNYLIESQQTITIKMDMQMYNSGSTGYAYDTERNIIPGDISIKLNIAKTGSNGLVPTMGHEALHAAIGNKAYLSGISGWIEATKSYASEILSFSLEYRVGEKMGLTWDSNISTHQYPIACQGATPYNLNNTMIDDLRGVLKKAYGLTVKQDWPNYNHWRKGGWSCSGPPRDDALNSQQFLSDTASVW